MIYITGDTHNTLDMQNVSSKTIRHYCGLQNVDKKNITTLIVLGDFGLPWFSCPVDEDGIHPENKDDRYLLKWYKEKSFNILALMGNHDNYNMLEKLPEVEMYGGKVLKVSRNIFYLKRGYYYDIEGKSFLVLGGAKSHDKLYRIPDVDWWQQEEWSAKEQTECLERINTHGSKVDFVLSHTGPVEGIRTLDFATDELCKEALEDTTVKFNTHLDTFLEYRKWFFGHWHEDCGFANRKERRYIPLYHSGVVVE